MHNITQAQRENILLDAAIVYINYGLASQVLLGVTKGGVEFAVVENIRAIEYDGRRGRTMGMEVVDQIDAHLKMSTLEITQDNLYRALGAAKKDVNGRITNSIGGVIADSRYLTNVTAFGYMNKSQSYKKITLKNVAAFLQGGLTLSTADKGEASLSLQFDASWNPADINEEIYTIEDSSTAPASVELRQLTISCSDGTNGTIVTIEQSARAGMGFTYKSSAALGAAPTAGSTVSGATSIISGNDISTTHDYYIEIFEIDASSNCYGYGYAKAVITD